MAQMSGESFAAAAYRDRAQDYVASATHSAGADLDRIETIFSGARKFENVLDLGCGGGHVGYRVAPHVDHIVACDVTSTMLDLVKLEAKKRGLANLSTRQAEAEALPFADEMFDAVLTRYSAHHWRDVAAGLCEMRRVLRRDGLAVFADAIAPANPLVDSYLQTIEVLRDASHVRNYNLAQWVSHLGQAGFGIESVTVFRLRIDFAAWVARTRTSDLHRDAVLSVLTAAPPAVRARLAVEEDGSFMLDTMVIVASTPNS